MENKIYNLKISGKAVKEIYVGDQSIAKFSLLKYLESHNNELIDTIGQMADEKITPPNITVITEDCGSLLKYRFFYKWEDSNGVLLPSIVPSGDRTYYAKRHVVEMPKSRTRMEVTSSNLTINNPFNMYTDSKLYLSFKTPRNISVSSSSIIYGSKYKVNCTFSFRSYYVRPGQTEIHIIPVSFYTDSQKNNKIGQADLVIEVYYESLGGSGD